MNFCFVFRIEHNVDKEDFHVIKIPQCFHLYYVTSPSEILKYMVSEFCEEKLPV